MSAAIIAAFGFGALMGWITYWTLRRTGEAVAVSSIASVGGAVGGAAIMASIGGGKLFAWYCISLTGGFFLCLILNHTISKKTAWLGTETEYASHRMEESG